MDRQKRVARGYQEVDMNRHETAPTHSVYWIHEVLYRKEFERVGGVFEYMDPGRSTIETYFSGPFYAIAFAKLKKGQVNRLRGVEWDHFEWFRGIEIGCWTYDDAEQLL